MDFGAERKKKPKSPGNERAAANIDRLLSFFTQRCNHSRIQEWRQDIENQQAKKENRMRKRIAIKIANRDYRRAMKSDHSPRKKGAWELAREFLKRPAIVTYYKKNEDLPALDPVKESVLKVQAAQQHFVAQAKEKRSQAQACRSSRKKALLKQQAACFDALEHSLGGTVKRMNDTNVIKHLSENPALTLMADNPVVIVYREYAQFMQKAAKLGLGDDPYIRNWHIHQNRQAGSKGILSKPISTKELEIFSTIDSMRHQGYSWRRIHQVLMKKNFIPKKSWQAFQKWLNRRHLQELYTREE